MDATTRVALTERVLRTLGDTFDSEAFCLTLVPGASTAEVLFAFGVDADSEPPSTEQLWSRPTLAMVPGDGFLVVVESNGWQGTRREVLRRLPGGIPVAGLYRNVNALTQLTLARDGELLFAEEVLEQHEAPSSLQAVFAGLDFEAEPVDDGPEETAGWWTSSLAVVEGFTGCRIDGPAPGSIPRHLVLPWLEDPPSAADGDLDDRAYQEPLGTWDFGEEGLRRLVDGVLAAAPEARRRFAVWAAAQALTAVGLADDPRVVPTLVSLGSGDLLLAPETERLMREEFDDGGEDTPVGYNALKALEHAIQPDTARAALGSVSRAGYDIVSRARERQGADGGPRARPLDGTDVSDDPPHAFLDRALAVLRAGS